MWYRKRKCFGQVKSYFWYRKDVNTMQSIRGTIALDSTTAAIDQSMASGTQNAPLQVDPNINDAFSDEEEDEEYKKEWGNLIQLIM